MRKRKVNKERDSLNKLEKVIKQKTDTENKDSKPISVNKNKTTINSIITLNTINNNSSNTYKNESQIFS